MSYYLFCSHVSLHVKSKYISLLFLYLHSTHLIMCNLDYPHCPHLNINSVLRVQAGSRIGGDNFACGKVSQKLYGGGKNGCGQGSKWGD